MRLNPGARLEAAFAVRTANDAGEISTDGEPATARSRLGIQLLVALLAALTFAVLQLAIAQNGSAATGDPCPQMGMETVTSDAGDYAPGSTAHFSGTGYSADCDVQLNIYRPDSVVDTATVTTGITFGNFTYDYPLPPPPGVISPVPPRRPGLRGRDARLDGLHGREQRRQHRAWLGAREHGDHVQFVVPRHNVGHVPARQDHASGYVHGDQRRSVGLFLGYLGDASCQSNEPHRRLLTHCWHWARIRRMGEDRHNGDDSRRPEWQPPRSWMMETFTNTTGTTGEQNDTPPVLVDDITKPSATITFLDGCLTPSRNPVLQTTRRPNVHVRITSIGSGIKYPDVAIPPASAPRPA